MFAEGESLFSAFLLLLLKGEDAFSNDDAGRLLECAVAMVLVCFHKKSTKDDSCDAV